MARFVAGEVITTAEPSVEVTVSANDPLPPGQHRFQLVVVDDSGSESEPAVVDVVVIDDQKPTAVLDAPRAVRFGASFTLSGARSVDVAPGRIVRYRWLRLS